MDRPLHIVVLSGAGISAESGLPTFRGDGGLWEGHSVYEVATPEAWERDPEMVLRFYNMRRQGVRRVKPNAAHLALAELDKRCSVSIITQNVDDLHERAGSNDILHLHGEIMKARSTADASLVTDLNENDIKIGDQCELGSQLRPHIVWFGEDVPMIGRAAEIAAMADVFIVVGTSLAVYPAAGLLQVVPDSVPIYIVNPEQSGYQFGPNVRFIEKTACEGIPEVVAEIRSMIDT